MWSYQVSEKTRRSRAKDNMLMKVKIEVFHMVGALIKYPVQTTSGRHLDGYCSQY